ncbi:MAG TPA: ABC transporter substrate-binding protein [Candidatus Elarobacter sp.]|nr:ABC transporter substrate-binding protein [Candidatus Elarobacter sp.]
MSSRRSRHPIRIRCASGSSVRVAPFVGTIFAESDAPYYLAPAHLLGSGTLAQSPLAGTPVGTGPYRLTRWLRNDRMELDANPSYWGGAPSIAHITLRFMPDENTQLVGLRTGEIDGVLQISANAATQARAIPDVRIASSALNAYWGVMMNNARGPTRDVRVRRALAAAIDARVFRDDVTHGFYTPPIADLPPVLWAADRSLRPIAYDPVAAHAQLEALGYGPNRPLTLDLAMLQTSQTHRLEAVVLQDELRRIGVQVRVHAYQPNVYDAPAADGGILPSGRYDLAFYGWFAGMDPDDSGQFSCDQRPPAGYDHAFYCSAAMDAAQRDALRVDDERVRKRAYARIEALLLRDVPVDVLGSPVALAAWRVHLSGYAPSLVTETANAQRWRLHS